MFIYCPLGRGRGRGRGGGGGGMGGEAREREGVNCYYLNLEKCCVFWPTFYIYIYTHQSLSLSLGCNTLTSKYRSVIFIPLVV
jgi:hypothetical protein